MVEETNHIFICCECGKRGEWYIFKTDEIGLHPLCDECGKKLTIISDSAKKFKNTVMTIIDPWN